MVKIYTREERAKIAPTWNWRIRKAGYNPTSFMPLSGVHQGAVSQYIKGKKVPSLETFLKVENKLVELGV